MGLLLVEAAPIDVKEAWNRAILHAGGCSLCPLRIQPGRMEPTGSKKPLVYMLGEAPGKEEVKQGRQFVGSSGQVLRRYVPKDWLPDLRWNNSVRSHPPKNRDPTDRELECCRPSIIADIERTKPETIFGFGNVPLKWVSGFSGISLWRGRRMPVYVGSHKCWYYAFMHPAFFLRQRGERGESEDIRAFEFDMRRAFAEVDAGLPMPDPHTPEMAREGVEIVRDYNEHGLAQIEAFLAGAAREPDNGLDYETNRLRPYEDGAKILSAAVSIGSKTLAWGIDHPGADWVPRHRQRLDEIWGRYLRQAKARKAVHNLSFEQEWSGVTYGLDVIRAGLWEDTSVQAAVLDERKGNHKPGCFSLEFLVQQYFGFNIKKISGVNRNELERTPLPRVLTYNAVDAKYHLLLLWEQRLRLTAEKLQEVYDLTLRRVPTLVHAQIRGIPVNQATVRDLRKKYQGRVDDLLSEIFAQPVIQRFEKEQKKDFEPFSAPDVIFVFHKLLGRKECEVLDKYKKETKLSAGEEVLEKIDHPLSKLIIKLRKANRNRSAYIDSISDDDEDTCLFPDGLLHPTYNTIFSETGRLSAENPNLMGFPKRDHESKEVRCSVIAGKDDELAMTFDYGQIEARVAAMFTHDKRFCKALWERYDIHGDWARRIAMEYPARIGGKKFLNDKQVMKDLRTDIKNQWTFPLIFGASLDSIAGYLKIPVEYLKPVHRQFWREFAEIKNWQDRTFAFYKKHGYVACLTKRRRRAPLSFNQLINSPIQGTACDIFTDAMCRLSELGDPRVQLAIPIHDDMVFLRVKAQELDEVAEKIIDTMINVPFDFVNVPIAVEMSFGKNWGDLQEFGTFSSDQWKR